MNNRRRYRQFFRLLLMLVAILLAGSLGYWLIEDGWTFLESLYMTVITITTVGFGEVREISPGGRIFTMVVILLGLGLGAAIIARIGQIIVESGITGMYGRRRMNERIRKLRNHYLLCGYGRTGSAIARKLAESGIPFVVIDSEPMHIETAISDGYPSLLGDASDDSILLEAGVKRARGTVLCVGNDQTNVNMALAARELNSEQNIISRGTDPALEYRLVRSGADTVVYPMRMGGEQIARAIADEYSGESSSDQGTSSSMLGYELRVVRNADEPTTVGAMMRAQEALRPVAVRHANGSMTHNPTPGTGVGTNDSLLLLIHEERKNRAAQEVNLIQWSDEMSLGSVKLDKEHKRIFKIAEDLQAAVLDGMGRDTLAKRYEMLTTYLGSHFHREEVMMRENGYPGQEEHQLQHEELTRQIQDLNADDRYDFPDETWDQLDRWLAQHFMSADKRFTEYLKGK